MNNKLDIIKTRLFEAIKKGKEGDALTYLTELEDKDLKNVKDEQGNTILDLANFNLMPVLAENYEARIKNAKVEKKMQQDKIAAKPTLPEKPKQIPTQVQKPFKTEIPGEKKTEGEAKIGEEAKTCGELQFSKDIRRGPQENQTPRQAIDDLFKFIVDDALGYCKKQHNETMELVECCCPRLVRSGEDSPRVVLENMTIEAFKKAYPLSRYPTLNLLFVGEGKFLSSAVMIGKLNQLGYSVNVTLVDLNYITLSDAYVSKRMDLIERYKKEHDGKLPPMPTSKVYRTDVTDTTEGQQNYEQAYLTHLESYRRAFDQYQHSLSTLSNQFAVKNQVLGCFSKSEGVQGVLKQNPFAVAEAEKTKTAKRPGLERKAAERDDMEKDIGIYAYEAPNGEYAEYYRNYQNESAKRFHGVFLIDIDLNQAYLNQIMLGMPEVFRDRPLVFESTGKTIDDVRVTVSSSRLNELGGLEKTAPLVETEEIEAVEFYRGYSQAMQRAKPK